MTGRRGNTGLNIKHGLCRGGTGGPEYRALHGIKTRCLNPKTKNFHRYGGRGIKICARWLHGDDNRTGVECFIEDLGPRPTPSHSIERMDNDGDYEPSNCRWATPTEQSSNTRRNKILEYEGASYTIAQASREFGVPYTRLYKRIFQLGWSLEKSIKEEKYGRTI